MIVYSVGPRTEVKEVSGVKLQYIRPLTPFPWRHLEFQIRAISYMRTLSNGGDIAYFHGQPEGGLLSHFLAAKKFLWYDFYQFRGCNIGFLYHFYGHLLKQFDLLLAVSNYCKYESQGFWKLPPEKVEVVYNGVSLEQFHPDEELGLRMRRKFGISKMVVLYVGRVCRQKGSDVLIEAMQYLGSKREDVQLVVAGPIAQFGNIIDRERWVERIREVGGIYLGPIEENEISAIYNMADVFVIPTREFEMFGMAAIEAQACGKPVVSSDHGGLMESVPEACGGRFQVGDSEMLANKVAHLLSDSNLYQRCSHNAFLNASTYSWENICIKLEEVYRRRCAKL